MATNAENRFWFKGSLCIQLTSIPSFSRLKKLENHKISQPGDLRDHLPFCFCLFVLGLVGFFFFVFLGPHLWHMEVPRLGVESELQLPAYTTAPAPQDLSRVCDLHHNSQQPQIPNPLREARDQTRILMDTSQVHYH